MKTGMWSGRAEEAETPTQQELTAELLDHKNPPRPTPEQLKEWGKELTGECKVVERGDRTEYVHVAFDGTPLGPFYCDYGSNKAVFSGRRWILRDAKPDVRCFEWIETAPFDNYDALVKFSGDALVDGVRFWRS